MKSEIRKIVRQILRESYWTEKDWNDYFSSQSNVSSKEEGDDLYNELEEFLKNKESFAELDVLEMMKIAQEVMPEVNEYDLIDLIKSSLSRIEEMNDEMDGIIRGRASRAYKMIDSFYEKVNEVVSAISTSPTDNQTSYGVSATSNTSTDDQTSPDVQEESKEKPKTKKRKPKDAGNPYTISLPSGSFFTF